MIRLIWEPLQHPIIQDGYLISPNGDIRHKDVDESQSYKATYHATNGYDFALFVVKPEYRGKNNVSRLFPIDEIIAMAYIPVPSELEGKRLTVKHINGDTKDISLENLEWVEDIEIWKDVTYPGIEPNRFQVSNWGNLKDKDIHRKSGIDHGGYLRIVINAKEYKTHRLVAWEFCKYNIDFMKNHVNHIDGVKTHNIPKNLEVITLQDNNHHAKIMGLFVTGENQPLASITNDVCEIICKLIVKYKGIIPKISDKLLEMNIVVPIRLIQGIKEKTCWTFISDKYFKKDEYRSYPKYSQETVEEICKLNLKYPKQCKKIYKISKKLGLNISLSAIKQIVNKFTWRNISDKYF